MGRILPQPPPKDLASKLGMASESSKQERREGIQRFCEKLLKLEEINIADDVFAFMFLNRNDLSVHWSNCKSDILQIRSQLPNRILGSLSSLLDVFIQSKPQYMPIFTEEAARIREIEVETNHFKKFLAEVKSTQMKILDCDAVVRSLPTTYHLVPNASLGPSATKPSAEGSTLSGHDASQLLKSSFRAVEIPVADSEAQRSLKSLINNLEKDIQEIEYNFQRRQLFERYLISTQQQIDGKSHTEFSDVAVIEKAHKALLEKFSKFSREMDKDYSKIKPQLRESFKLLINQIRDYYSK